MRCRVSLRESFCESEEGVRLPRETANLRGSPGNFRGSPGNFRGSLGNFRGTSGLAFSSTVRELPGKSPKTSGEVRGTSGEVRGLSRSSREPDSLPVTRQICLQISGNLLSFSPETQKGLSPEFRATRLLAEKKGTLSGGFLLVFLCLRRRGAPEKHAPKPGYQ